MEESPKARERFTLLAEKEFCSRDGKLHCHSAGKMQGDRIGQRVFQKIRAQVLHEFGLLQKRLRVFKDIVKMAKMF